MKTERKSEVDLLRVIAMLFVIAIHTLMLPAQTAEVGMLLLTALLFASNGAFFMISGRFNLDKRFHSAGDILKFYFKRLLTIVFPLLVTTTLMYVTDVLLHDRKVSLGWLYASFMGSYANTHLWFVYVLIGLIFSTPILAKAVQNMDHGELHILFALGLVWAAAKLFLAEVLGLHFPFSGWILGGHAFLFFLGYYLHTTMNPKMKKWIYLAGIAGFVATVFFFIPGAGFDSGYVWICLPIHTVHDGILHIYNGGRFNSPGIRQKGDHVSGKALFYGLSDPLDRAV